MKSDCESPIVCQGLEHAIGMHRSYATIIIANVEGTSHKNSDLDRFEGTYHYESRVQGILSKSQSILAVCWDRGVPWIPSNVKR